MPNRLKGYSLVELLIVVGLLGLVAAVATPAFNRDDGAVLDRAAASVARAIRFAHSEARRTGQSYGVIGSTTGQSLRVYRLDESVSPPAVIYDVYDPLTRELMDLSFDTAATPARIDNVFFKYVGQAAPAQLVGFQGGAGTPKYNSFGTVRLLETGFIELVHDGDKRRVIVSPVTGRVTIP